MKREDIEKFILDTTNEDEKIILADGYEEAFVGISRQFINCPIAVYDREKCIDILMKDMSNEEAEEYFEFNVQGSYVGENTPAFINMLKFNKHI